MIDRLVACVGSRDDVGELVGALLDAGALDREVLLAAARHVWKAPEAVRDEVLDLLAFLIGSVVSESI